MTWDMTIYFVISLSLQSMLIYFFCPAGLRIYHFSSWPRSFFSPSLLLETRFTTWKFSDELMWMLPLWPGVVAPDKGPIYGLNSTKPGFFVCLGFLLLLFCFFLLTAFKLRIYAKETYSNYNFWHLNCVFMLNWIIWNKIVLTLTLCIAQSAEAVEYTDW